MMLPRTASALAEGHDGKSDRKRPAARDRGTRRLGRAAYQWISQIADPVRAWRGMRGLVWYWRDYLRYRGLPGAEPIRLLDLRPLVHERVSAHELDAHYFYLNAWAMRRIEKTRPSWHVDVGSQVAFASLASALVPVVYLDYRPLAVHLCGLRVAAADLLHLPFRTHSIPSLSCLHVAEHVGLGRYGDPLDPAGTRKAAAELTRVLAPGGDLYFAVPVGRARLDFNAHRVHAPADVPAMFPGLQMVECSGVHDDGRFVEMVDVEEFGPSEYACGMFRFRKAIGI